MKYGNGEKWTLSIFDYQIHYIFNRFWICCWCDCSTVRSMGRIFLEHLGGTRLFSCANCDTVLTNRSELMSTRFTGSTGRAFLFKRVVNLWFSEVQDRIMLTGRHMVRDVFCKYCDSKLGWIYEFAVEESQRYKEGKVILERALITESECIE